MTAGLTFLGGVAAAWLLWLPSSAAAAERTLVLTVENMTCALCPLTVAKAIGAVDGVRDVSVDDHAGRAIVRYDDAIATAGAIAEASTNAGYPAVSAE